MVRDIEFVSKRTKIGDAEFRHMFENEIEEVLGENPLNDSFEVHRSAESADSVRLDAFMAKAGDYPALSWETPTAAVLFAIAPAIATPEINRGTYTGSTTAALPAADALYSYTGPLYTSDAAAEEDSIVPVRHRITQE